MKLFLDNMLPPGLASILNTLDYDAVHLRDVLPADKKDEVWLPYVGKHKLAIVTVDHRIAKSRSTQEALKAANTVAVFLFSSFQQMARDDQVAWIIRHASVLTQHVAKAPKGTNWLLRQNGKIEPLN